jgi:hypothetical protein
MVDNFEEVMVLLWQNLIIHGTNLVTWQHVLVHALQLFFHFQIVDICFYIEDKNGACYYKSVHRVQIKCLDV